MAFKSKRLYLIGKMTQQEYLKLYTHSSPTVRTVEDRKLIKLWFGVNLIA